MTAPIFKIMPQSDWAAAQAAGVYRGSADDARDGFMHFSTGEQVAGTLAKHFAGQLDLVLVTIDPERIGAALVWEPARSGLLFPHLYGDLPVSAVVDVERIAGG